MSAVPDIQELVRRLQEDDPVGRATVIRLLGRADGRHSAVLGETQRVLLERATRSRMRTVMPANFLERRACKRLERRGLLVRSLSLPDLWRIP